MKRTLRALLAIAMFVFVIPSSAVYAEEDYSDTTYWSDYCAKSSNANSSSCKAYKEYLQKLSDNAQADLADIQAQRAQIAADIAGYDAKLKQIQAQISEKQDEIDAKQIEINDKQTEIDAKQVEIDAKQVQIDDTQTQVTGLEDKVKARMVSAQGSMRLSQYTDILMGASSFEEFLRIANGLQSINEYDQNTLDQLIALKEKLSKEKAELDTAMGELQTAKTELETKMTELEDQKATFETLEESEKIIIEEAQKASAELEAQGNTISSNLSSIQNAISSIASAGGLDGITAAAGWTNPVPGAYRSAGTWNYSSGAIHLGYDFAASVGTTIVAAGNGVVINSANGCPTYGGLGNTCGAEYGGSRSGGNQVYLLIMVNGNLYAVKYLHMRLDTPIATGTIVVAGQKIGEVGSSGNSSGAHCHVEIFYLGDASNFSNYARSWSGDLTFGCGWAGSYNGYGRRCQDGYGAPCRIRPESVFGG